MTADAPPTFLREGATIRREAVGREGLTGGRHHLLVRHIIEHPAFDCELTSRQPLPARKL